LCATLNYFACVQEYTDSRFLGKPEIISDFRTAITIFRNNWLPGDANITTELLKHNTLEMITEVFNEIITFEKIPNQWPKNTIM